MPLTIPNTTLQNAYAPATTFSGQDIFEWGFFTIANAAAFVQLVQGQFGQADLQPEVYCPPATYPIASGVKNKVTGIRARNAVAGQNAQFFGSLFYPGEPGIQAGTPFTGTISPAGSVTGVVSVPVGGIILWPGASPPASYLICDGSAISRTVYAGLFAAIGVTYGVGDGSTTFNIPDFRGRVPVGLSSGGPALINTLANNDGRAANLRNISHFHNVPKRDGAGSTFPNASGNNILTQQASSGDANNQDNPAFLVMNYCIATGI